MKKAKAMLLADALESGEYRKAKGQLRKGNTNRMCCLGVACNIFAQKNPKLVKDETDPEQLFGESEELPFQVLEWFGFKTTIGELIYNGKVTCLAQMNDGNYSHKQLAAVIRKHWKEL